MLQVERVIIAFLREDTSRTLELVRMLKNFDVHVDIVPRLFEVVGPNVDVHTLEGVPLIGLPTPKLSPSSRMLKRAIDVVGASVLLLMTAPIFAVVSIAIWWDSGLPVFFRQRRLGIGMEEFTILKFRTMKQETGDQEHREAVKAGMNGKAPNGGVERRLQGRAVGGGDARGRVPPQDEPRRAAAADQRPPRRHVARRASAEPAVRDRPLRAAPFRAVSRSCRSAPASGR